MKQRPWLVLLAWLACASGLPAATTLTLSRQGQEIAIEWRGAGMLETAESVRGPWKELPAAVSPHRITATAGVAYFRLKTVLGLVNGDFEQGPGVGWTQEPGPLIYRAQDYGLTAYAGEYVAYLGWDVDNRRVATLSQRVTLPVMYPLYLNLAIWLYSDELCDVGYYDWFGFYIDGQAVLENARLCSGNTGGDGWRRVSIDISAYAGRNVVVAFQIGSNLMDPLASWALLDAIGFSDQTW